MHFLKKTVCIFSLSLLLCQCSSSDVGIDDSLKFPDLKRGKFWIFSVVENNIVNGKASTFNYTLKEQIVDTLTLAGQLMYQTEISRKFNDEGGFTKTGSKFYYETPSGFYEKIGSSTIQRLSYPVYIDNDWYYDKYLGENPENIAKCIETKKEVNYGEKKFDNGFQIQIKNDSTGLFRKKNFEVYQQDLGLVYSELIDEDYCQETKECIGRGIIVNSKIIIKTLIDNN
jgi:hypothetical protein